MASISKAVMFASALSFASLLAAQHVQGAMINTWDFSLGDAAHTSNPGTNVAIGTTAIQFSELDHIPLILTAFGGGQLFRELTPGNSGICLTHNASKDNEITGANFIQIDLGTLGGS